HSVFFPGSSNRGSPGGSPARPHRIPSRRFSQPAWSRLVLAIPVRSRQSPLSMTLPAPAPPVNALLTRVRARLLAATNPAVSPMLTPPPPCAWGVSALPELVRSRDASRCRIDAERGLPAPRHLLAGGHRRTARAARALPRRRPRRPRPHDREPPGHAAALRRRRLQTALLPVDGVPHRPVAAQQPRQPRPGRRGADAPGGTRPQPRRGRGLRGRRGPGQRRPRTAGGVLPRLARHPRPARLRL